MSGARRPSFAGAPPLRVAVATAVALAAAAGGCAAIAGLDQTYRVLADGGAGERSDATLGDSAAREDAATGDASGQNDASPPPGADGGTDADAAPAPSWAFDQSFGQEGVLVLGDSLSEGTLPTLEVDRQQTLRVAYATDDDTLVVCEPSAADAGCGAYGSGEGFVVDLISNDAGTVAVLDTSADVTSTGVRGVPLWSSGYTYNSPPEGRAVDALALDESGNVQIVATRTDSTVHLYTLYSSNITVGDDLLATLPWSAVSRAVAAAGDAGEVWLVGAAAGDGAFAQVRVDGSGTTGSGAITASGRTAYATDVLPVSAVQSLVVGNYSGGSSGLFALAVPAGDDGGVHTIQYAYDLNGGELTLEPEGHTRVVPVSTDPPYLIVGTTGNFIVVAPVNADGSGGGAGRPQTIEIVGVSSLDLGGAIAAGGAVYLALSLTAMGGTVPVLVRLVRH